MSVIEVFCGTFCSFGTIEAVAFAIENGAQLKWEVNNAYQEDNFLDKALNWVKLDGIVCEEDEKLLKLIAPMFCFHYMNMKLLKMVKKQNI